MPTNCCRAYHNRVGFPENEITKIATLPTDRPTRARATAARARECLVKVQLWMQCLQKCLPCLPRQVQFPATASETRAESALLGSAGRVVEGSLWGEHLVESGIALTSDRDHNGTLDDSGVRQNGSAPMSKTAARSSAGRVVAGKAVSGGKPGMSGGKPGGQRRAAGTRQKVDGTASMTPTLSGVAHAATATSGARRPPRGRGRAFGRASSPSDGGVEDDAAVHFGEDARGDHRPRRSGGARQPTESRLDEQGDDDEPFGAEAGGDGQRDRVGAGRRGAGGRSKAASGGGDGRAPTMVDGRTQVASPPRRSDGPRRPAGPSRLYPAHLSQPSAPSDAQTGYGGAYGEGGGGGRSAVDWGRLLSRRHMSATIGGLLSGRPQWNSSPMRSRPSALRGLRPVTREPWAEDEDVYNRRFETREEDDPHQDKTARKKESEQRHNAYINRFDSKYTGS